jgi:thiol-disulfide isomerase/thioredoxin
MARCILAGLMAAAIVMISGVDASAGGTHCRGAPASLGKFTPTPAGSTAPETPFFLEDGSQRTLAGARGRALVVNFWATWCAPCVKEMPALDRLDAAVDGSGIDVVALSADRDGAKIVRQFYDKNAIASLAVTIDRGSAVARALSVGALPTTVLYDRNSIEVARVIGTAHWDAPEVVAFLRRCLAAAG